MKKVVSLILALAMCLTVVGCAPKTVEEACKKADKLVEKWDDKTLHQCEYSSEYFENLNGDQDYYTVYITDLTYSDMTDYAKNYARTNNSKEVYEELKDLFEKFDVIITVIYMDEYGNTVYATMDGKEA